MSETAPESSSPSVGRVAVATGLLYAAHVSCMPLLPLKADASGWSDFATGALVASYVAVAAVVRILCPTLLPRLSVRRWFVISAAILFITSMMYGILDPSSAFYPLRGLQGIAFALFTTSAYSWVSSVTSTANRGRSIATIGVSMSLALVFAPPLVVWADGLRPGLGFLVAAAFAVLALPFASGGFVAPAVGERSRFGATVKVALVGVVLAGSAIGIVEAFGPLIIVRRQLGSIALLIALFGLTMVLGRISGGWFSDRIGRVQAAVLSATSLAIAMASYPFVWTPLIAYLITAGIGFGAGACLSAMSTLVSTFADSQGQVRAMAAVTLAADLGIVVGTFLAGSINVGAIPSWGSASIVTAVGCALVSGALISLRVFNADSPNPAG